MKPTKCCVCGNQFELIDIVEYKRKKYCHNCFETNHKEDVVDLHYFYLRFQELLGRKPSEMEWTQCRRMIDNKQSSGEWNWRKLENLLIYVYEIEGVEPTNEHGAIGILPYYELKAKSFFEEYNKIYDYAEQMSKETNEVHVKFAPRKREEVKPKLKSIDNLINWEED